jgi:hypothetical protein
MRKTILTILGSALLVASTIQIAAAAEHHKARKAYRTPAPVTEPWRSSDAYRNSNASYAWPASPAQSDWSRYSNGGLSAPAGQ